jgi:hypothetical protein
MVLISAVGENAGHLPRPSSDTFSSAHSGNIYRQPAPAIRMRLGHRWITGETIGTCDAEK